MRRFLVIFPALLAAASAVAAGVGAAEGRSPLGLLEPIVRLDAGEQQALRRGETIIRTLDAPESSQLVVFAASRIDTTPSRFESQIRRSAFLWQGLKVPRTGTIETPVGPSDIAQMVLPPEDVSAVPECRPGDCAIKLSAAEMARLKAAMARHPGSWHAAVRDEFQAIVLDRLAAYRRGGLEALGLFLGDRTPVDPQASFLRLLADAAAMAARAPDLADYLARYPQQPLPSGANEHMYWLETTETPRPTIQAWHVTVRGGAAAGPAEVVVLSRQIFATHYVNGSLAMTLLVRDTDGQRYLFYINRTSVDGLGGLLGGVKRFFVERRIRSGARGAFTRLRERIESGD